MTCVWCGWAGVLLVADNGIGAAGATKISEALAVNTVLVAALRLPLGLLRETTVPRLDARLFESTRLVLPPSPRLGPPPPRRRPPPAAVVLAPDFSVTCFLCCVLFVLFLFVSLLLRPRCCRRS